METRGTFVGRFVPWGISGTGYIISPLARIGSLWRRCATAKLNSLSLNFRLSSIRDNERQDNFSHLPVLEFRRCIRSRRFKVSGQDSGRGELGCDPEML